MAFRQKYNPNVGISAQRGWCLKYVDDAGNAPSRTPTAAVALNNERNARRLRTSTPPVGIWVVGFLDMKTGSYAGIDHVFFMKYLGSGRYEIRDSETQGGARRAYGSPAEVVAWFGAYKPVYVGWSTHCDGRQYVEEYTPVSKKSNDTIANEVIAGKWGVGVSRKARITAAGYNYNTIQALVNKKLSSKPSAPAKKSIDTIANEVIAGKWGNGPSRVSRLRAAGYNPVSVQDAVNKKLR